MIEYLSFPAGIKEKNIPYKVKDNIKDIPLLRPEALSLLIAVLKIVDKQEKRVYAEKQQCYVQLCSALQLGGDKKRSTGYLFTLEFSGYDMDEVCAEIDKLKKDYDEELKSFGYSVPFFRFQTNGKFIEFIVSPPENPVYASSGGLYVWPVPGHYTISSVFMDSSRDNHKGIDISAPAGTPVVAAAPGLVVFSQYSDTAGNWIAIKHGDGYFTRYMHHQKNLVPKGTNVVQGQQIALVGNSGKSRGNHLHFEVRKGGTGDRDGMAQNPEIFLRQNSNTPASRSSSGTSASSSVGEYDTVEVTAYAPLDPNAIEGVCYSGDPTVTASGHRSVPWKSCAAGPGIPFFTEVWIEGFGNFVVHDRGGKISNKHIDIMVSTREEAFKIGRKKNVKVIWRKP